MSVNLVIWYFFNYDTRCYVNVKERRDNLTVNKWTKFLTPSAIFMRSFFHSFLKFGKLSANKFGSFADWLFSKPSTFVGKQYNLDQVNKFCISKGSVVIFFRYGGQIHNPLCETSLEFCRPENIKISSCLGWVIKNRRWNFLDHSVVPGFLCFWLLPASISEMIWFIQSVAFCHPLY